MKNTQLIQRLAELEAKVLDPVLFGPGWSNDKDEDDGVGHRVGNFIKGTATAGGIGGAYLGHRSVMRNYGGAEGGAVEAYRNAGRNVARSAEDIGGRALAGAKTAGKDALASGRKFVSPLLQRLRAF